MKVIPDSNQINAVILAGGSGTRLWPLSRLQLPKQFLKLQGDKTLLEATIERLAPVIEKNKVLIVTGAEHAYGEAYTTLQPYNTILEPVGRNTAPAIAIAAASLLHKSEYDPTMVVLPADHIIKEAKSFQKSLHEAIGIAKDGKLVTFGIKPTRPDTGFGYIKAISKTNKNNLIVESFKEKPDINKAKMFIKDERFFWNSGMFVWRASVILAEIQKYLPDIYSVIETIQIRWQAGDDFQKTIDEYFPQMSSISIDNGVLEKSDNVALIPCDIGWSDVGSWDAVHEIAKLDDNGNALQGNTIVEDCSNSLIHSNKRLVAAVGIDNICIVETPDAVLVTEIGKTQRVREIVDKLKEKNASEHVAHLTVQRPWGQYTVLEDHPGFKMKRITVNKDCSLSLQRHQHRSEHWIVVAGTATVTRDDEVIRITSNQSTYIPAGVKHRLENLGKIPLELIEVQVGEYLEEDDIERFEDDYGRSEQLN